MDKETYQAWTGDIVTVWFREQLETLAEGCRVGKEELDPRLLSPTEFHNRSIDLLAEAETLDSMAEALTLGGYEHYFEETEDND